jgi:hypothetical protein
VPRRLGNGESDRTARASDELADDGEAESGAARAALTRIIEAGEAFENPLTVCWRYAWTVVTDADHGLIMFNAGCYLHPGMRVTHGVVDQVPDRATQLLSIDHDHDMLARHQTHRDSRVGVRFGHFGNKIASIDRVQLCRWPAMCVGSGEQQQVLGQSRQPLGIDYEISRQRSALTESLSDLQLRLDAGQWAA